MTDFAFRIEADAYKATRSIDDTLNRLQRLGPEARRQGKAVSDAFGKAGSELKSVFGGAAAIAGVGVGGRELIAMADSMTNLRNRLRGVSSSSAEAEEKFERLRQIAAATRSDLASTGEGYVRIARATASMGLSQERVFSITETLGKALAQSGASSSEMAAGMMQLGQAMSSGRLQGDELRSVLENIPIVAEAIEKSLGVNRAGLRKMAEEGKITTAVIVEAFEKAKKDIDEGFGNTIPTIGQQFQALKNDIAVGAAEALASLGPVIRKTTADMEAGVRAQREAILSGAAGFEELIAQGKSASATAAAFADAEESAMAAGRKAIEDFAKAGDIGMARYRQALESVMGPMERITEQQKQAAKESAKVSEQLLKQAMIMAEVQKGGFDAEKAANEAASAWAKDRESALERHAEKAKRLREEYEKIARALLGGGALPVESHRRGITAEEERAISEDNARRSVDAEIEAEKELLAAHIEFAKARQKVREELDVEYLKAQEEIAERSRKLAEEDMKRMEESAKSLGAAFRPLKDALTEMFIKWDFDAEKFLDTLSQIALKLLEMAAINAIGGGGGFGGGFARGLLGAAHGGNFRAGLTGFAHGGGTDSQIVAFRKSPNETAHIQVMTPVQEKDAIARSSQDRRGSAPSQFFLVDDPRAIVSGLGTREGQAEMVRMRRKFRRRD